MSIPLSGPRTSTVNLEGNPPPGAEGTFTPPTGETVDSASYADYGVVLGGLRGFILNQRRKFALHGWHDLNQDAEGMKNAAKAATITSSENLQDDPFETFRAAGGRERRQQLRNERRQLRANLERSRTQHNLRISFGEDVGSDAFMQETATSPGTRKEQNERLKAGNRFIRSDYTAQMNRAKIRVAADGRDVAGQTISNKMRRKARTFRKLNDRADAIHARRQERQQQKTETNEHTQQQQEQPPRQERTDRTRKQRHERRQARHQQTDENQRSRWRARRENKRKAQGSKKARSNDHGADQDTSQSGAAYEADADIAARVRADIDARVASMRQSGVEDIRIKRFLIKMYHPDLHGKSRETTEAITYIKNLFG